MKLYIRHSWVVLLILFSCIEIYDYPFVEQTNYMVVEGEITTGEGPHKITLTTTRNIKNEENLYPLRVQGAKVSITSTSGVVEQLKELDDSGVYYTSDGFRAELGSKYQLNIVTNDGRQYLSDSVEVAPVPPVDSIGLVYGARKFISSENSVFSQTGFYVKGYLSDDPASANAYLIHWDYTYKVFSHPELANEYDAEGCECWVPTPKDCCAVCWIEEDVSDFSVVNDKINNGSTLSQYELFFLPVVGIMLYEKIYLGITIRSLTNDAYQFWKTIYDSKYSQGGLFDPTPHTVKSNIKNIEDENELVLGYFYASDVAYAERYIFPADFPERIETDTGYTDSCEYFENSTAEKPDYWTE